MKTDAYEKKPKYRKFYDFTMFRVVQTKPGDVLTPGGSSSRGRVSPLRRRRRHPRDDRWHDSMACYTPLLFTLPEQLETPAETEEKQWAASARRARLSWMRENPY